MVANFGVQALLFLTVHIFFLVVTWWALQSFRVDVFFKDPKSAPAKVFMLLLTVAISSSVGNFFLDYFNKSLNLQLLF
jgi:uncharacterized integral membrane protein (TIGR02327 family)